MSCLCVTSFLRVSLSLLVFVSIGFVSGRHGCAGVADGFVPSVGDIECCGAGVCTGGDAEGLVRNVALLEGELGEACSAREVAEEKVAASQAHRLMVHDG
jgi:hypothetical protein